MHSKRQKRSVKWVRIAPIALGGLFSCFILLCTMPVWHQNTNLDDMFQPSILPETGGGGLSGGEGGGGLGGGEGGGGLRSGASQQAQAGVDSRKALIDTIPLTNAAPSLLLDLPPDPGACSAEDRAYQAAIVRDTALWRDKDWEYYYGGFWGPWMEEQFFEFWGENGDGCPINGRFYIPIYYNLLYRFLSAEESHLIGDYMATLDTSKKYFTILLLSRGMKILDYDPPADLDLMIFAAGGITAANKTTNVPVPLLIKEQHVSTPRLPKAYYASFAGILETHPVRERLVELYRNLEGWEFYAWELDNMIENWDVLMEQSVFCLAPRGVGSTSFRMYEALQLGCIPVYIWDEEIMLPFTEFLDWNSFSIIIEAKNIDQLGQRLKEAEIPTLLAGVEQVRHMMTYKYTMQYIKAYLESEMPGCPAEYFKNMPAGVATCEKDETGEV